MAVFCCFLPWCISRTLEWKQSSQDSNLHSDMGCGGCRQQLKPLHHNAGPTNCFCVSFLNNVIITGTYINIDITH